MTRVENLVRKRESIFIPGSCGEPRSVAESIIASEGLAITTSFVHGINRLTPGMLGPATRVSSPFMVREMSDAQREGTFRHLPLSYFGMVKWIRQGPSFDVVIAKMSPPDHHGICSLGPMAEFLPEVIKRAGRVIAVVDHNVPYNCNAPKIAIADCADIVETDEPLVSYDASDFDDNVRHVGQNVAAYIGDGSTLQFGLGAVPSALMGMLHDHKRIRLHSGMLSDGLIGLADSGALDLDWPHTTTVVLGSPKLYEWFAGRNDIHLRSAGYTHAPQTLAGLESFVAVNSALEVDLFGACNLELLGGRAVSGVGGASDFAKAASLSQGGLSIIALQATSSDGRSRIVSRLGVNSVTSLGRNDVDVIVTEFGAADLRGKSVFERAEAIMAIAAPSTRSALDDAWRSVSKTL